MLATVVRVPELAPTFIEVEVLVADPDGIPAATTTVHRVLADLGVTDDDLTAEYYIDQVAASRATPAP